MKYYLIYECPFCGSKNKVKSLNKDKYDLNIKYSDLKGFVMKIFKCQNCFKESKLYIENLNET